MKHSQSLKTPHKLAVGEVLLSNALPETGWLTGSCLTSTVFALACSEALKWKLGLFSEELDCCSHWRLWSCTITPRFWAGGAEIAFQALFWYSGLEFPRQLVPGVDTEMPGVDTKMPGVDIPASNTAGGPQRPWSRAGVPPGRWHLGKAHWGCLKVGRGCQGAFSQKPFSLPLCNTEREKNMCHFYSLFMWPTARPYLGANLKTE